MPYLNAVVKYPDDPIGFLRTKSYRIMTVNATEMARSLGNERVASLILLGAVSKYIPLKQESWDAILRQRIPAKFLALNQRAFAEGRLTA